MKTVRQRVWLAIRDREWEFTVWQLAKELDYKERIIREVFMDLLRVGAITQVGIGPRRRKAGRAPRLYSSRPRLTPFRLAVVKAAQRLSDRLSFAVGDLVDGIHLRRTERTRVALALHSLAWNEPARIQRVIDDPKRVGRGRPPQRWTTHPEAIEEQRRLAALLPPTAR